LDYYQRKKDSFSKSRAKNNDYQAAQPNALIYLR